MLKIQFISVFLHFFYPIEDYFPWHLHYSEILPVPPFLPKSNPVQIIVKDLDFLMSIFNVNFFCRLLFRANLTHPRDAILQSCLAE